MTDLSFSSLRWFRRYILAVFVVKFVFLGLLLAQLYLQHAAPKTKQTAARLVVVSAWKQKVESIFIVAVSAMMLFLFSVRHNHLAFIDRETRFVLFIFAIVVLIKLR